jgi:superfamily II DNA helicase RecQ
MSTEDRQEVQRAWIANEIHIICATIAFGMGKESMDR